MKKRFVSVLLAMFLVVSSSVNVVSEPINGSNTQSTEKVENVSELNAEDDAEENVAEAEKISDAGEGLEGIENNKEDEESISEKDSEGTIDESEENDGEESTENESEDKKSEPEESENIDEEGENKDSSDQNVETPGNKNSVKNDAGSEGRRGNMEVRIHEKVDLSEYIIQEGGLKVLDESVPLEGDSIAPVSIEPEIREHKIIEYKPELYAAPTFDEDAFRQYLYNALKNRETEIDVYNAGFVIPIYSNWDYVGSPYSYYSEVVNAHPDLFYVDDVTYSDIGDQVQGNYYLEKYFLTYDDSYDVNAFYREKNKALATLDDSMSDMEKAIALHEYLVLNCEYDYLRLLNGTLREHMDTYNAYGVLVDKEAVCNGYALCYQYLLEEAGIEAYMVTSWNLNHAWNIAVIDGQPYQIDTTWDDPTWDRFGNVSHKYLLCSDATFDHNSSDWEYRKHGIYVDPVIATSTKYDNAFWKSSSIGRSQLLNYDGCLYYSVNNFTGFDCWNEIRKVAASDIYADGSILILDHIPVWNVYGYSDSIYPVSFVSMGEMDGKMYYSTPTDIYTANFDGTERELLFHLPSSAVGYIYGAHYENGCMYYVLSDDANYATRLDRYVADGETSMHVNEISLGLSDSGSISINFYIVNMDDSNVSVYIDGDDYSHMALSPSDYRIKQSDGRYLYVVKRSAKDIDKDASIKVVDGSGNIVPFTNEEHVVDGKYVYSVNDYLNTVINNPSNYSTKLVNLCESLSVYGDNAKEYFDSSYFSIKSSDVSIYASNGIDPLAKYEPVIVGSGNLVSHYIGSSLILGSMVSVRHYFDTDISGYLSSDSSWMNTKQKGSNYYVQYGKSDPQGISEYIGIAAPDLDRNTVLNMGEYTIKYSPLSYIKKARDSGKASAKLMKLLEGLYGYWYYAEKYFE